MAFIVIFSVAGLVVPSMPWPRQVFEFGYVQYAGV